MGDVGSCEIFLFNDKLVVYCFSFANGSTKSPDGKIVPGLHTFHVSRILINRGTCASAVHTTSQGPLHISAEKPRTPTRQTTKFYFFRVPDSQCLLHAERKEDFELNNELKMNVLNLLEEVLRDPDLLPQERKATANILR
ncbi:hypothetical protein HPG69_017226 [Diceros bicornis minor]|uniref:Uncharacterized protein n=1 Tax=Diceros bicornis minor TaxID=77932 RepID=A0A7J7EDX4_DICBM|nr:hypothetical protein HPG69_017226 [Diceros bicornis minor]